MKKILLIRFSSIGDIVLTTPVIRALKKQTGCELHVLVKKQYLLIFQNNPYIDKVHFFEKETSEIIPSLQAESFDFVVDLQRNFRSAKIRKQLAKPFATFPKLNIEKWLLVNFKINRLPALHVVDRYFEAVKSLDVNNDGLGLEYYIPENDEVKLSTIDITLKNGFVAFVVGGQHNTKLFPDDKVCSILNKLPYPVVLLGGADDRERAHNMKNRTINTRVFNLCGELNLSQSASLIRQSGLVISNDTGLMHIAAAFNKPIISIWGNTVPLFGMYPYMPGKENLSYFSEVKSIPCRPCSKLGFSKCPKNHFNCMWNQDDSLIIEKAMELFGKTV